jgi:hypothetical protein
MSQPQVSQPQAQPSAEPAPSPQFLEEPRLSAGHKAGALGAGVLSSVCCGAGPAAVIATGLGATGAVAWMRSWANMQGVTLVSTGLAIAIVAGLALVVTRRARAGLAPIAARQVYGRALFRLAAFALAGYFLYFIVFNAVLALAGFEYAGEN